MHGILLHTHTSRGFAGCVIKTHLIDSRCTDEVQEFYILGFNCSLEIHMGGEGFQEFVFWNSPIVEGWKYAVHKYDIFRFSRRHGKYN